MRVYLIAVQDGVSGMRKRRKRRKDNAPERKENVGDGDGQETKDAEAEPGQVDLFLLHRHLKGDAGEEEEEGDVEGENDLEREGNAQHGLTVDRCREDSRSRSILPREERRPPTVCYQSVEGLWFGRQRESRERLVVSR
jgi:hypothetical protein